MWSKDSVSQINHFKTEISRRLSQLVWTVITFVKYSRSPQNEPEGLWSSKVSLVQWNIWNTCPEDLGDLLSLCHHRLISVPVTYRLSWFNALKPSEQSRHWAYCVKIPLFYWISIITIAHNQFEQSKIFIEIHWALNEQSSVFSRGFRDV